MADPTDPQTKPTAPEPETFSKDYVRELREENKGWRLKFGESEAAKKAAEDSATKSKADHDTAISTVKTDADQRIIRAELKAAAIKAGMVDTDGLKLADLSTVKLNDAGEVEGAEALMDALKKAKPYLFGPTGSSNPATPPKPTDPKPKSARDMTPEEYAAARSALVYGR